MTRIGLTLFAATVAVSSAAPRAASEAYRVDPATSRTVITVGKAGAFSFLAGHTHQVSGPIESGTIHVDRDDLARSRIHLVIASAALKVLGADEPPDDRPKVQAAMESDKVLDVAQYPRITFDSTTVTSKSRGGTSLDLDVAGRLTIRGVTQPITAPVRVELTADGLTARGRFTIRQTDFGIKPVSVGGVVAVKNALDIEFAVAGRR